MSDGIFNLHVYMFMLCNGSVMFFVVLTIFLSFCFPLTCLSFFGFYLLVNILWAGRGRRCWVRKVPEVLPAQRNKPQSTIES